MILAQLLPIVADSFNNVSMSVIPVGLAALISSIPGLWQTGSGIAQKGRANKMAGKAVRPTLTVPRYNIPKEYQTEMNNRKLDALDMRIPGQDIATNRIDANTANAIAEARDTGAGTPNVLDTIARTYAANSDAKNDISIAGAQRRDNLNNLVQASILGMGQQKTAKQEWDKNAAMNEFEYNQALPFNQQSAAASAMYGAGNMNAYQGIDTLASLGAVYAMNPSVFSKGAPKGASNFAKYSNPTVLRDKPLGPPTLDQAAPIVNQPTSDPMNVNIPPGVGQSTIDMINRVNASGVPYNQSNSYTMAQRPAGYQPAQLRPNAYLPNGMDASQWLSALIAAQGMGRPAGSK